MYHLVYLTRNLINGKIYIGIHSTYDLNDGYLGSGAYIQRALKRYGTENFERTILHYCFDFKQMLEIEAMIVNEDFVKKKNNYNLKIGGDIIPYMKGQTMSDAARSKISRSQKGRLGTPWSDDKKAAHSKLMKSVMTDPKIRQKCSLAKKGRAGRKHSEESKNKISSAQRNLTILQRQRKSQSKQGAKNPMFGRKWYNSGNQHGLFTPGSEPVGWRLGKRLVL